MLTRENITFLIKPPHGVDNFPKSTVLRLGNLRVALLMANHINDEQLSMKVQEAYDDAIKKLKEFLVKIPDIVYEQLAYELLEGSKKLDVSWNRNYPPLFNISRQIGKAIIAMECFIILKAKTQSTAFEMIKKGDKKLESFIKTFEASTIKKNMFDF